MVNSHIRTTSRIADMATEWDRIASSLYASSNWLSTSEHGDLRQYQLSWADNIGEPDFGVVATLLPEPGPWGMSDPIALLLGTFPVIEADFPDTVRDELNAVRALLAADELYPAAVCALPNGYLPGIVTQNSMSARQASAAVTQFDELSREWTANTSAVMYVPAGNSILRKILESRGYVGFGAVAECYLDTRWPDFDTYLAQFPYRYRKNIRREIARFDQSGATLVHASTSVLCEQHAELQLEHMRKFGNELSRDWLMQLLDQIKNLFFDHTFVIEMYWHGKLTGFVLVYDSYDWLYPKMLGLVSPEERPPFAYFNLGYYEVIRYAIAHKRKGIVMGPEAYETKSKRRCGHEHRIVYLCPPATARPAVERLAAILDAACRRRIDHYRWHPDSACLV